MIPKEFELNRQMVMSLPEIVYEETDEYRRVIILEECSCTPLSDACPVCVASNKTDDIPFGGE